MKFEKAKKKDAARDAPALKYFSRMVLVEKDPPITFPPITAGDLMDILSLVPEDSVVEIFNAGNEWYGVKDLDENQVKVVDGRVVINFGEWKDKVLGEEYELKKYREFKKEGDLF